MKCRFCATPLEHVFLDLGSAPPSNAYLAPEALSAPETYFPLKVYTCTSCFLVQIGEVQSHALLFASDYAYFSSFSSSWLSHAERFVDKAVTKLGLGPRDLVLEIASNDGYLLQYVRARGIPCVGIEPTVGTATAARAKGIETIVEFFGEAFARRFVSERGKASLVVANNVLAHVPDLNDFVAGVSVVLEHEGVVSVEFPHLQRLVDENQFDTIYHEHFSYFSLFTVVAVFAAHGLRVLEVERLPTHGGSLRVWASHRHSSHIEQPSVREVLADEASTGMQDLHYYSGFQRQADGVKNDLLEFLLSARRSGLSVVGYGAAAKGNTLLNYAGVRPDLLPYVVDASPHKQGRFLPGSRIPIVTEDRLHADKPQVVVVLPWNLREEISNQLSYVRVWGGKLAVAVPRLGLF